MSAKINHSPEVRVMAFDLDGTLAAPAAPLDPRMADLLSRLLHEVDVCVVSGGAFDRLRTRVAERLDVGPERLARLHLLPVNGTRYHRWRDGAWHRVYAEDVPVGDREKVAGVLVEAAKELGFWQPDPDGEVIADQGSRITFCVLGADAPAGRRKAWDPDNAKQDRLRALAAERLPDREVRSADAPAVEVSAKGVNKALGVRRLMAELNLREANVVFVGDRLDRYGDDHPVKALGVECVAVSDWQDTADFVQAWIGLPHKA